ncbi:MAG: DUF4230 domain-containing protein [Sphingobium sp.]
MKKLVVSLLVILAVAGAALGGGYYVYSQLRADASGSVESVTTASIAGLHEQARLTPFIARFVAVVTSRQQRLGLSAERTMIMPGTVRYEIDLTRITRQDVQWDEASKTLTVRMPPLILAGPEVDLAGIRQYGESGLLTMFTDAEKMLDDTNRKEGQAELMKQAKAQVPMRLARDAARSAIERTFALPLRAIGLQANVVARFADEQPEQQQGGIAAE